MFVTRLSDDTTGYGVLLQAMVGFDIHKVRLFACSSGLIDALISSFKDVEYSKNISSGIIDWLQAASCKLQATSYKDWAIVSNLPHRSESAIQEN